MWWVSLPTCVSEPDYLYISFDCWGFLCVMVGSLPYNIKLLEATAVMIWHYINKTELNCIPEVSGDQLFILWKNCGSSVHNHLQAVGSHRAMKMSLKLLRSHQTATAYERSPVCLTIFLLIVSSTHIFLTLNTS